jgi:hypothetical protein
MRAAAVQVQTSAYTDIDSFAADIRLMVANAKHFNQPGSTVYNDAVVIGKTFEKKYGVLCQCVGLPQKSYVHLCGAGAHGGKVCTTGHGVRRRRWHGQQAFPCSCFVDRILDAGIEASTPWAAWAPKCRA